MPDTEAGCCLGPEGSGVSSGEGGEQGPSPPGGGKHKQSVLSKGRDNMGKDGGGPNNLGVMKEDRREQSEWFSDQDRRNYVIMIAELILTLCFFFQENKSYGVKKPFALILCLSATEHHVANTYNGRLAYHNIILISHIHLTTNTFKII